MEGKDVDAVALVRRIRDELYEQTKDMSTGELIAFYRLRAAPAKERLLRLRAQRAEIAPRRA